MFTTWNRFSWADVLVLQPVFVLFLLMSMYLMKCSEPVFVEQVWTDSIIEQLSYCQQTQMLLGHQKYKHCGKCMTLPALKKTAFFFLPKYQPLFLLNPTGFYFLIVVYFCWCYLDFQSKTLTCPNTPQACANICIQVLKVEYQNIFWVRDEYTAVKKN